jgi:hypothetical protein
MCNTGKEGRDVEETDSERKREREIEIERERERERESLTHMCTKETYIACM